MSYEARRQDRSVPSSPDPAFLPRNNTRTESLRTLLQWARTPMTGQPLEALRNRGSLCKAPTGLQKASTPTLSSL